MKNTILVIVQCRYNSKRLYGKALWPISGMPMLVFLLRRLRTQLEEKEYRIFLATTKCKEDDAIETWGQEEGVQVVRGEDNDVLSRFIKCIDCCPAETVVRVTADNPLTCPEIIKWLVWEKKKKSLDYVQCQNLPCGAGVDVFSSNLLKMLDKETTETDEREHINLYILRNIEKFKTFFPNIEGKLARPDIRMTVDTKEDWRRVKALFSPNETEPWKLSIYEAIERMDQKLI